MATVFFRHDVADYAAWRRVYDSIAAMQKAGGVVAQSVYRSVDDPNEVTVMRDFATIEAARAFVSSPALKTTMEKTGVSGPPMPLRVNSFARSCRAVPQPDRSLVRALAEWPHQNAMALHDAS
jgi:hypothetical protein